MWNDVYFYAAVMGGSALGAIIFLTIQHIVDSRKLDAEPERARIGLDPVFHHFPEVGPHGHVTIDCIVRPSARTRQQIAGAHQQLDHGLAGVHAQRVGSLDVEVGENGFRLLWKPAQGADQEFFPQTTPSPFIDSPPNQSKKG